MKKPDSLLASQMEVLEQIKQIIASETMEPAEEMIACGRALMNIGEALKGVSPTEARSVMRAVVALFG